MKKTVYTQLVLNSAYRSNKTLFKSNQTTSEKSSRYGSGHKFMTDTQHSTLKTPCI